MCVDRQLYYYGLLLLVGLTLHTQMSEGFLPSCQLKVPKNYSRFVAPVQHIWNGKENVKRPVVISLNISLMGVIEANDQTQMVDVVYGVFVQWKDFRIFPANMHCLYGVVEAEAFRDNFWMPSLFFHNVADLRTVGNFDDPFMVIYALGNVITGRTVLSKMICKYDFTRYPFDTHECDLQIGSIKNEFKDVQFKAYFEYDTRIQNIIQYELAFDLLPEGRSIMMAGFNLSVAGVRIKMARRFSTYLYNIYVPTFVLTLSSLVSFFIPSDIVPGRMGMLVTLFLMLINTSNRVRSEMPKTSGVTAAEIWLSSCTAFISVVILEYFFILQIRLRLKRKLHPIRDTNQEKKKLVEFDTWAENFDFFFFTVVLLLLMVFTVCYTAAYASLYEASVYVDDEITLGRDFSKHVFDQIDS